MPQFQTTYYCEGLLRQGDAQLAREYLGIESPPIPQLPPPPTLDWPQSVTKTVHQSVVSTDTPRDDDELLLPIEANAFYLVELFLLYSGNSAQGDYRGRLDFPSLAFGGSAIGFVVAFSPNLLPEITAVQAGTNTQFPLNDIVIGISGDLNDFLCAQVRLQIRTILGGTLQYQFANGSGADGRTVITKAGSTLRMQRLA